METEYISCNFCHSQNTSLFDQEGEWKIVKCRSCGLCYTNPRPVRSEIAKIYNKEYYRPTAFAGDEESLNYSVQKIADVENLFEKRGSLLEIGAVGGDFLNVMSQLGWKVAGVEMSEYGVEFARSRYGLDLFRGSFEDFATEEKFDAICMYQTLEHLYDPASCLKKSFEYLNPGGKLIIEVPNLNSFDSKISKVRRQWNYSLPIHLYHFTPEVLEKKLEDIGFSIVYVDQYFSNFALRMLELYRKVKSLFAGKKGGERTAPVQLHPAIPMFRTRSQQGKLMKTISDLFPGWRFTIVAVKNQDL
jgi:2-polyprenyl-3-methyl-5-hydroxy-6-metoxy-1,4-benzoquinol methylase